MDGWNLHTALCGAAFRSSAGLAIEVFSNTASTLKLDAKPAEAGLVNGMVFVLRKHVTLGSLLPDGGGLRAFSDSISLYNGSRVPSTYLWNATARRWIDGLGADASGVVVRPGQGMLIQAGKSLTLTLGLGEACIVKTTPTRVRAAASVPNLLGALNPLAGSTTLGSLGIAGRLRAWNDSVVVLAPGTLTQTGTYLSNGSQFIDGRGTAADATAVPAGAGVVINVDAAKALLFSPPTITP